jgi:fructose-1,6-bisphosphatase
VLSNASSRLAKAKLRLLFEAAPIALIIEAAGGSTCVCATETFEQMGKWHREEGGKAV